MPLHKMALMAATSLLAMTGTPDNTERLGAFGAAAGIQPPKGSDIVQVHIPGYMELDERTANRRIEGEGACVTSDVILDIGNRTCLVSRLACAGINSVSADVEQNCWATDEQGVKGPEGDKGPKGDKGPTGDQGESFTHLLPPADQK